MQIVCVLNLLQNTVLLLRMWMKICENLVKGLHNRANIMDNSRGTISAINALLADLDDTLSGAWGDDRSKHVSLGQPAPSCRLDNGPLHKSEAVPCLSVVLHFNCWHPISIGLLRSRLLHYYNQAANSNVWMCRQSCFLAPVSVYQRKFTKPIFSSVKMKNRPKQTIKILQVNNLSDLLFPFFWC